MRALSLLCMVVAAFVATGPSAMVVRADELYPRCSGNELSAKVAGTQEKSLYKTYGKAQTLLVECLAFEIKSMSPKGVCEVAHQTMLPFGLYIRAKGTFANNIPYIDRFDVKDVVGGSINRLTVTTPVDAEFELIFENKNTNPDCLMSARAIFTHTLVSGSQNDNLPTIVNLDPRTAYEGSATNLVVKHSTNNHADALLFLVPVEDNCASSNSATNLKPVTDAKLLSKYLSQFEASADKFSVWTSPNPRHDNYKVCASVDTRDKGNEIALLTVFGGNPMYFEVAKGSGDQGKVYTNSPITLRFHGYDLDTRPYKDMAKLVDEAATCDANPAGGVPLATDLGPADSYGPNTVITEWTFSIVKDGGYKVCYKRFGAPWIDVPSIDDLPPGAVQVPTTTTRPPIPTNPRSKTSCPLASPRDSLPKYSNNYLKLTFKQSTIPSYFRTLLAEVLCVPQSAIVFPVPVDTTKSGAGILYLDIECDGQACGSQDRKDYLLEIANNPQSNSDFNSLMVALVEEVSTSGIITRNNHHLTGEEAAALKRKGYFFVIGCFTLIAIAAIAVYGVIQFRKNQHHFIQFGIDDDDEIEVQDGAAPARTATQASTV